VRSRRLVSFAIGAQACRSVLGHIHHSSLFKLRGIASWRTVPRRAVFVLPREAMESSSSLFYGDLARQCYFPSAWASPLQAWCDEALGGLGLGGIGTLCAGVRRRSPSSRSCRDLCMPDYQSTSVEPLEASRRSLALIGQLTVVSFRVLTGQLGGGLVGMVIFIAGNQARCTLKLSSLTGYVVLSTSVGTRDLATLLQQLFRLGSSFFPLPFEANLTQDLLALALMIAPLSELTGAWAAYNAYPSHDMLFNQHIVTHQTSARPASYLMNTARSMLSPDAGAGALCSQAPQVLCCAQSTQPVQHHEGRLGTGTYSGHLYCNDCWAAWSMMCGGKSS